MSNRLLIFGFGYSSAEIARKSRGDFSAITGTTRRHDKVETLESNGYSGFIFDGNGLCREDLDELSEATHLVMSIAPGEKDPVLACLPDKFRKVFPKLEWAGYLSTVGVYGNHDGEWVNEETPVKPVSKRSIERMKAETDWSAACQDAGIPLAIFRLSGIYGPGRNAFINIEKGNARRLVKPGQVFNRIHREDIGTAVASAIKENARGIFNITDNEPSPPQDVVTYAHSLMGLEPPPEIEFEKADLSPMARSFYGENKRVSNEKSKDVLGMDYAWPDYKSALKRMWREGSWKVPTGL